MGRKKTYHFNRKRNWRCPYFGWDGYDFLRCECGKPSFDGYQEATAYMKEYCSGDWEKCSLAKARAENEVKNEDRPHRC